MLLAFVDFDYKSFYAEVGMTGRISDRGAFAILTFTLDLRKTCLAYHLQEASYM